MKKLLLPFSDFSLRMKNSYFLSEMIQFEQQKFVLKFQVTLCDATCVTASTSCAQSVSWAKRLNVRRTRKIATKVGQVIFNTVPAA